MLGVLTSFGEGVFAHNPTAQIAVNPDKADFVVDSLRVQEAKHFCLCCYLTNNALVEVRQDPLNDGRIFFRHKDGSECFSASGTSEFNAKAFISEVLKGDGLFQNVRQYWWRNKDGNPDIALVREDGEIEAHEVQISPISAADLRNRTEDLRTRGNCAKVVWYLGKGAFNPENRRLLRSLPNVECYRLAFPTQDADFPEWQLDDRTIPNPATQKSSQSSACHKRDGSRKHLPAPPENPAPMIDLYQSPRSVVITAPHPSCYTGMALDAIGESDGLIVVPLPKLGDRPDYQGFFLPEHVQFA